MGFDIRDYWLIWEDALRKGDRYREILVTPQETRFRLIHDLDVNTYLKKRIPGTPQPEALNFEITRFRTELRKFERKGSASPKSSRRADGRWFLTLIPRISK
jgi:hypothetical protein